MNKKILALVLCLVLVGTASVSGCLSWTPTVLDTSDDYSWDDSGWDDSYYTTPVTNWSIEDADATADTITLKLVSTSETLELSEMMIEIEQDGKTVCVYTTAGFGTLSAGDAIVLKTTAGSEDVTKGGTTTDPTTISGTGDIQADQMVAVTITYIPTYQDMAQLQTKAE